jgi:cytochrome c-type biogenesis protein CcmH
MKRIALALLFVSGLAFGQASEVAHPDAAVEARLKALAEELRCLVCQNQTIADSNASLALDLRNEIREQVSQGKSDDEIRAYMVARYGDFVLYRPPWKSTTVLLWAGPFVLLAVGFTILFVTVRRRRKQEGAAPEAAGGERRDREEVEALLKD